MKIALFPLNIVVFPGEQLNLHIFEQRYRDLIHDAEKDEIPFGIPVYHEGEAMKIGTTLKLDKIVKTYDDGKLDISTIGMQVFKLMDFESKMDNKSYPGGEVAFVENIQDASYEQTQKVLDQIQLLYDIMRIKKPVPSNNKDFSVFQVAHKIGLNFSQEKMLLETPSESDRQILIYEHLKKMIPMVEQAEEMRKKIQMNGYFKNLIPPNI